MFYCNNCAKEKDWPTTIFKSVGRCEICNSYAECNDTPSRFLPSRGLNHKMIPFLIHYGDGTSERIKDVIDFEGRFIITDHGRLFSINGKWKGIRLLNPAIDDRGYYMTNLRMKPKNRYARIHQLVGEHFVDNPNNKPCINHKDGDKLNNHYTNLEWCTIGENVSHAFRTGLIDQNGEKHHNSILKNHDIPQILELRKMGLTHKNIGGIFGVSRQTVADVLNGSCWSHVSGIK